MGERDYLYGMTDRQAESKYPSWKDGESNLFTFLDAINKSQPIVQSQYEMVWSRWPRTRFFAKGFSVPGIAVATQEINHAGFTISIPTHVKYETTEVNFTIIADKEGYHYYDIRNMVLQSGHPLVAGDTRATIGNNFGLSPDEDTIEVWVRNHQEDAVGHHWVIHNFRPTKIGDIELSQDGSGFVEFEVTGTFTHITYDCGTKPEGISEPPSDQENQPQTDYDQSYTDQNQPQTDQNQETEGQEEENKIAQAIDFGDDIVIAYEDGQTITLSGEAAEEYRLEFDETSEPINNFPDESLDWEDDSWEDWNDKEWQDGGFPEGTPSEYTLVNGDLTTTVKNLEIDGNSMTMIKTQGYISPEEIQQYGSAQKVLEARRQDAVNQAIGVQVGNNDLRKGIQSLASDFNTKTSSSSEQTSNKTNINSQGDVTGATLKGDIATNITALNALQKKYDDAKANGSKNTVLMSNLKRQIELQQIYVNALQKQNNPPAETRSANEDQQIQTLTQSQLRQVKSLFRAVEFNHNLDPSQNFIITVTPIEETNKYKERLAKTSLPGRFGMYKPSKSVKKIDDEIQVEEVPEVPLDSAADPSHKFRSIF